MLKNIALFTISTLTLACGDDTTIITTFQTVGSDTNLTFVTNPNASDGAGATSTATDSATETTTGDATTEAVDETTLEPTTFGGSETTVVTDTDPTTGEDLTTDDPVQDPPAGCAHFVEINGAQSVSTNYVVIDSSSCARNQTMQLTVGLGTFGTFPIDLGFANGCHVWGGDKSPANFEPGGTVIAYPAPNEPPHSYWLALTVDGLASDDVRVPAILQGQTWDNMPDAPNTPTRRADDFSWRVLNEHVVGCDLMPSI